MLTCYVDEVGCAAIAGPALVCAVATEENMPKIDGVKDSKKLSRLQREKIFDKLSNELYHAYGSANVSLIEKMNIHWAKYEAMKRAVETLVNRGLRIEKVIVDGNFTIPNLSIMQEAVIKADDKLWQAGAASILAKVTRDRMMEKLGKIEKFSHYDWEHNAGYYTPKHRDGIIKYGPTELHRTTFKYFKYCLFEYKRAQKFIVEGNTIEDFFIKMSNERIQKTDEKSGYCGWRDGEYDEWKPLVWNDDGTFGEKNGV